MTSALIVDGQDPREDGEGMLVEHVARRLFRHVVRLPYFPETRRRWTMTWFSGHVTLYRSAKLASLETRRGSYFYRVADRIDHHKTDLLVLASCNTKDARVSWDYGTAKWVITHRGPVTHADALVFAARFMPSLQLRRGHLFDGNVQIAFADAVRAARSPYNLETR